ncbi:hypothetical protein fugu_017480, partial [Takifugu bimaculatus]
MVLTTGPAGTWRVPPNPQRDKGVPKTTREQLKPSAPFKAPTPREAPEYGRYLGLLRDDAAPGLTLLLRRVKAFLSSQRIEPSPELRPQQEGYPGHDWLASSVFMVTRGEAERSLRLLLRLSCLPPLRLHLARQDPRF